MIVEDTEPLAMIRIRVMESTADVQSDAMIQGEARGIDGPANASGGGIEELRGPRQLQPHLVERAEAIITTLQIVVLCMHCEDFFRARLLGFDEILELGAVLVDQTLADELILSGREYVQANVDMVAGGVDVLGHLEISIESSKVAVYKRMLFQVTRELA
jgi:hypothetical protein